MFITSAFTLSVSFIYLCRKTNISICCFCVNRTFSLFMMGFMLFTLLSICILLLFFVCQIEVGFLLTYSHCAVRKGVTHGKHAAPGWWILFATTVWSFSCKTLCDRKKNTKPPHPNVYCPAGSRDAKLKTECFVLWWWCSTVCCTACALSWIIKKKPSQCFRCFLSRTRSEHCKSSGACCCFIPDYLLIKHKMLPGCAKLSLD